MAHHKRRRPKMQRAGCLLCKPHKGNGAVVSSRTPVAARRQMQESVVELVGDDSPETCDGCIFCDPDDVADYPTPQQMPEVKQTCNVMR